MTFVRPTLDELIARTDAELATRLGMGPFTRRSVLAVIARTCAGLAHAGHGHIEHVAAQLFPQTASRVELERHASLRGLARKAATFSHGALTLTGTPGSAVPAATRVQRIDGVLYETLAAGTIGAGGSCVVEAEAVLPGSAGNAPSGSVLTLSSALPGVSATAASGTLEGGEDEESDEALRARVLASWRARPMAGTAEDYVRWALEVPGITRAWCAPNTPTLGQVTVRVVADGNTPTIAPTSAQLTEVQGHIDALRPVTARASVVAPALEPLDLTLSISPSTPALRAAVEANIRDAIRRLAVPGATLRRSQLSEAIAATPGELYHSILTPSADVTAPAGAIFVPGVVTWS